MSFNGHKTRRKLSPAHQVIALWRDDRHSARKALAAKCVMCVGLAENTEQRVRECRDGACPLWPSRPFQKDVEPKSAPHVPYTGLGAFGGREPREVEE